jgi:uncharacterized membrane protein YhhN
MLTQNQSLLFTIASLTTGICVLGLLWAELKASQTGKWIFKPLAAAGFIVGAFAVGAHTHAFGQWVLAALILSMLGDILLIPARVGGAFTAGLGAFLLGHVAFAIAFIVRGIDWTYTGIALAIFSVIGVGIYGWLQPNVPTKLRIPVMAYVAVITVMVALSVSTTVYASSTLIPIAAAMFWLSDISVARGRFMNAGFSNRLWGIPFYFGAQVMFAYATLI